MRSRTSPLAFCKLDSRVTPQKRQHVIACMWLVLEGVREGATARINETSCGTRICPDYHYKAVGLVKGRNVIEVELNTTLARQMHNFLSGFMPLEPAGLTGAWLGTVGAF